MVLAMVGVVATFAAPRINFTQYRMDTGVRLTRTTLQRAQRLAITRQYDVVVSFDIARNRIRLLEDCENNASSNNGAVNPGDREEGRVLEEGARFTLPPVGLRGSVTQPIVGAALQTLGGMPSVIFRRDGSSSTDLEVYLGSRRGRDRDFRAVSVVQSTGRTDWYRRLASGWKAGSL